MSSEAERLIDEVEIGRVVARLARGIDRAELELVRSCFHADGWIDVGGYIGPVDGFPAQLERLFPLVEMTQHFLGNQVVEFDGDSARVETYCQAIMRFRSAESRDRIRLLRYCDRFERRDGEWRIAERVVVYEADLHEPGDRETAGQPMLIGQRGYNDPALAADLPRRSAKLPA